MPEKFYYQTMEGEKPFDKKHVEDLFLMLNLEKARKLAKDYSLEKPKENIHSAIDISNILKDGMSWEEIMPIIQSGKFDGVNVGTDQIKTREQAEQIKIKIEENQAEVVSFHGSTDPFFYGITESPSGELVKHDFEIADILNPDQSLPINYDLVFAEVADVFRFQQGERLLEIHRVQREKLAKKGVHSERDIIERIVKFIAQNRPDNSKRPTVFEISQPDIAENPKITVENLEYFIATCRKYFKNDEQWGLTIDVGHTIGTLPRESEFENTNKMREEVTRILQVLKKYKRYIKMIHVSGDVTPHTLATYKLSKKAEIDSDAVKAMGGLHQVIDNHFIVEMVKKIREIMDNQQYVENSEVRPIHSAAKNFGDTLHFDKKQSLEVHKEQLQLQAEILGYTKK